MWNFAFGAALSYAWRRLSGRCIFPIAGFGYSGGKVFAVPLLVKVITKPNYLALSYSQQYGPLPITVSPEIQGVSKRALQLWKLIEIYTEDIHNVFNRQNVAKHTEFYLG
jgi:hypothetical protein